MVDKGTISYYNPYTVIGMISYWEVENERICFQRDEAFQLSDCRDGRRLP